MDFAPGDVVVCVDVSHDGGADAPVNLLTLGSHYRVDHIGQLLGFPVLHLVEPVHPLGLGWHPDRFRRLNDGTDDAELIERIKRCEPVKIGEPA